MVADIKAQFPNLDPNSKQERTLRDNLRSFLKTQDTGTANPDGDSKPELQDVSVMGRLKMESSNIYHTKVIQTKRHELIASAESNRVQRKRPKRSDDGSDLEDDFGNDENEPRTKKECLVRTALAIENIANSLSESKLQRDVFFKENSEKHKLFKEDHGFKMKRRKNGLMKEELDLLETKRRLGLVSDSEFDRMAKKVLSQY